jgi:transcriptional regulator with XRE-family HTH domain
MSDGLTGTRADWLSLWKAAAAARGFSYRAIDDRAGLTDGYFSRLACGDIKEPTAATIAAINRALDIRFHVTMRPDSVDGVGGSTKQCEPSAHEAI